MQLHIHDTGSPIPLSLYSVLVVQRRLPKVYMAFCTAQTGYIDAIKDPPSQRNNTPGSSMPIRELQLRRASVNEGHKIVVCVGM